MDINKIDLESLVSYLVEQFRHSPPEGPIVGRTQVRDAVAARLGCSQLEAEQVVDTLVASGRASLVQMPDGSKRWQINERMRAGR